MAHGLRAAATYEQTDLHTSQGNNSSPFYFLFALSIASFLFLLFFVDLKKSRSEQVEFLQREKAARAKKTGEAGEAYSLS